MVRDFRIEAEVLEVLGDDGRLELAVAEAFTGRFVVVEFLDELREAQVEESLAGDLRVVFRELVAPFPTRNVSKR